jgi:hypothetical protein
VSALLMRQARIDKKAAENCIAFGLPMLTGNPAASSKGEENLEGPGPCSTRERFGFYTRFAIDLDPMKDNPESRSRCVSYSES